MNSVCSVDKIFFLQWTQLKLPVGKFASGRSYVYNRLITRNLQTCKPANLQLANLYHEIYFMASTTDTVWSDRANNQVDNQDIQDDWQDDQFLDSGKQEDGGDLRRVPIDPDVVEVSPSSYGGD